MAKRKPPAPGRWTCPACHRAVSTPYCPHCGERPLRARDLTLRGLFDQAVQALSSVDGRVLRSFKSLIARPGALTLAYLDGPRKPYILPLQLFLIANVLFFAMESLTGVKVFSTTLDFHLHDQEIWRDLAQRLVAHRLAAKGTTLELYTPIFNRAVALNAKSLIGLMVLPFAALPALLFARQRRPFVAHAVFALHLYAFVLLLFCAALVVSAIDEAVGGAGLASKVLDRVLSVTQLVACAVYLYVAIGAVYGARGAARTVKAVVLALAVAGIGLGYRFALFLITLYGT